MQIREKTMRPTTKVLGVMTDIKWKIPKVKNENKN